MLLALFGLVESVSHGLPS
jgi:hypothetical protein